MKTVKLVDTGLMMDLPADLPLAGQVWEGTDEEGEPVKFVVACYILTGKSLAAMHPPANQAPDEGLH